MKLSKSTIHIKEYIYTTISKEDVEFRALTYKELNNIQSKYSSKYNQLQINTVKLSLLNPEDFYLLTLKDIEALYKLISEVSSFNEDDIKIIKNSLNVILEDSFKDSTFQSCETCQARGLDKQRNCPLLKGLKKDPMVFWIIDGKKIDTCPMNDAKNPIVDDALKCYNMLDSGVLPSEGGLYDQTMFFVELGAMVKGLINKHTEKKMSSRK